MFDRYLLHQNILHSYKSQITYCTKFATILKGNSFSFSALHTHHLCPIKMVSANGLMYGLWVMFKHISVYGSVDTKSIRKHFV